VVVVVVRKLQGDRGLDNSSDGSHIYMVKKLKLSLFLTKHHAIKT